MIELVKQIHLKMENSTESGDNKTDAKEKIIWKILSDWQAINRDINRGINSDMQHVMMPTFGKESQG